jgi:hypothetical protein
MPDKKNDKKEEKNNLDVDEAREIVLDAIGEKKKEKKEEMNMKINGKFLEDIKKSKESLASKMPLPAKVLEKKTTKPKKEKPDSKEIEATLDNIAKFKDLKDREKVNLDKEVKATRAEKNKEKTKDKVKIEEKKETAKPEPAEKEQEKKASPKIVKPAYYKKPHPAIKNLIFTFLISNCLFIILYSAFALLLTRFNIDNKAARFIAGYLPVPAIISSVGMIEYYNYKDLLKQSNMEPETLKLDLIKILVKNSKIEAGESGKLKVWSLVE